ncbi:MAG: N-acetyltransferase [Bacteroidia bacterium]|nr:N-acetyltransferase [Bacteroidia bacterium]
MVLHQQNGTKGSFFVELENKKTAEMTYVMAGSDKMIIDHTEVSAAMEGKGVGKQLVAEAVNFARANKLKIMPLCPFAKAIIEKNNTYNDVLF